MRILEEQLRKFDLNAELNDLQLQLDKIQWKGKDQKILFKEVFCLFL